MSAYYKWYRKIFGCTQFKIHGGNEKLLNTLSEKKIDFWGTELDEEGGMSLYGSVFSSAAILNESANLGCSVVILKRKGLPFIFERYKKRYGLMVGIVLAWIFLFYSSLFIWEVRVADRNGEDKEKICLLLQECGLEMGSFLPRLNVREIENQFLINNPEYSFMAVNIYGTVANIELRRAATHEEHEKSEELCNIIASKSGTIISVEAYNGAPLIKVGDTVDKGDLLISAYMQGRLGVWRGVHAYGKVTAAVYYDFSTEIPLNFETVRRTGSEETKTTVNILGMKLHLFADESSRFEKCEVKTDKYQSEVFGIMLPINVEKAVFSEQEHVTIQLSEDQAKEKAETEFRLWQQREINGEILSLSLDGKLDTEKNVYKLEATLTVAEDIAIKQFIS